MIHLLGVRHSFQVCAVKPFSQGGLDSFGSRPLTLQFERYLGELLDRLSPQAICEAYGEAQLLDAQKTDDQAYLVAQRVCLLRGNLAHVFCDPDQSERDALYATHRSTEAQDARNGYPIREREWLKRMPHLTPDASIIFICGAHHISTFREKLEANGYDVSVVCKNLEHELKREQMKRLLVRVPR